MKKIPVRETSKNDKDKMPRRSFLGTAATAAAAFTIIPRHVLGAPGFVPPSEKVNIAIVGAGGQGRTNVRSLFNEADAQIMAVCDVNESADYSRFYYGGVAGRKPVIAEVEEHHSKTIPNYKCKEYVDFREMLEKETDIDAVLCATPDHAHAVVTMAAIKSGKHVYCEKPLTHNIWEARQIAKAAKEAGVATQMGNHGHSGEGIRLTCEWIWDGAIGPVREVEAWSNAGFWIDHAGRPGETQPVPEGFDWDLWLGPREARPYHIEYAPYNWRGWWAFGSSTIGDMAVHNLDPAMWALDLKAPKTVESVCVGSVDSEVVSSGMITRYHFDARGDMPPVKVTWYDCGLRPERPAELEEDRAMGDSNGGNGIFFHGDKGTIMCGGWGGTPRIIPEEKMREYAPNRPEPTIKRVAGHHRDWLDACKGGDPASSNFDYGAALTELVHLGNVSLRTGKKLDWDAENMRATNAPEADQYIKEAYRPGWEIA